MRFPEKFTKVLSSIRGQVGALYEDEAKSILRGDVTIVMRDAVTGEVQETRQRKNLIVKDASILIARLVKDNSEPTNGAFVLAVGTGDSGWNPMSPPAPTNTQRALYSELTRKVFVQTQFIDSTGVPTSIPTNVVDFTTTLTESEGVGPLVEMGILGGNISTNLAVRNPVTPPNGVYSPTVDLTTRETMLNYLSFAVINKPPTSTLTITWRLTF